MARAGIEDQHSHDHALVTSHGVGGLASTNVLYNCQAEPAPWSRPASGRLHDPSALSASGWNGAEAEPWMTSPGVICNSCHVEACNTAVVEPLALQCKSHLVSSATAVLHASMIMSTMAYLV